MFNSESGVHTANALKFKNMNELILKKLEIIERYSLLAAKSVLNLDDVHLLTGYSKSQLYRMTCRNEIPFYKRAKLLCFDKAEIEAWMKQNRHNTVEEAEKEAINYCMRKESQV